MSFDPVNFFLSLLKTALWCLLAIGVIIIAFYGIIFLFSLIKQIFDRNGK